MRSIQHAVVVLGTIVSLFAVRQAHAGNFNSASECTVGARVVSNDGHRGRITRVDRSWSYCYMRQDDTGKEVGYLYSLLRPDEGAAKPASGKLAVGDYTCWVGSEASAAGLRITGAMTYESSGQKGSYHLEASGKIVFESGPFAQYHAMLLANGRIGMNLTGGSFYNLACDPPH